MFGVGIEELFVIAIVAVIMFGPERMPEMARQAARALHMLRGYARRAQDELRNELGPEYANLNLADLNPREAIRRQIREALAELDAEDARRLLGEDPTSAPGAPAPLLPAELPPYDVEAT